MLNLFWKKIKCHQQNVNLSCVAMFFENAVYGGGALLLN